MSDKPEESAEAFDARWEAYFNRYGFTFVSHSTNIHVSFSQSYA